MSRRIPTHPMFRRMRPFGRERGQVVALLPLFLAILGGVSALAIDLGSYTTDRRDLQNAADAIALAAAQDLPSTTAVQTTADSWATKNRIALADMTVSVTQQSLPGVPNPKVTVTIARSHSFTFARLIGIGSSNVSATANAIRTSPGGTTGMVPWSVTAAVLTSVSPGNLATLKYDSNNVTGGNFGALALDGSGASTYRTTTENGSTHGLCAAGVAGCVYPSTVSAETGNMVGPTRTAVDYRINNTDAACNTWAKVTLIANGRTTLNPTCNPFIVGGDPNSRRIIIIPVVASLCTGSCTMTITQFALFFIEGYANGQCNGNGCSIQGRFIDSNMSYGAKVGVFDASTLSHFVQLVQ